MIFLDLIEHGKVTQNWLSIYNKLVTQSMGYQKILTHPPTKPESSLPLSHYIGAYKNLYFGTINIAMHDGKLNLTIGPKHKVFILHNWNRDVFYLETRGENATGKTPVIFTIDADNYAQKVTVAAWNKFGMGIFTKETPP